MQIDPIISISIIICISIAISRELLKGKKFAIYRVFNPRRLTSHKTDCLQRCVSDWAVCAKRGSLSHTDTSRTYYTIYYINIVLSVMTIMIMMTIIMVTIVIMIIILQTSRGVVSTFEDDNNIIL